jgi:hypothetical protein
MNATNPVKIPGYSPKETGEVAELYQVDIGSDKRTLRE